MKKIQKISIYILILLAELTLPLYSIASATFPKAERTILLTDRSIYITGEDIRFYATVINNEPSIGLMLSQVLYAELITPEGKKIAGGKFLMKESSVSGCLIIPGDLLTGTYYVRTYTKLMQNYGPGCYGYKPIRIINPVKSSVLNTDNSGQSKSDALIAEAKEAPEPSLAILLNKSGFAPRETISFSVKSLMEPDEKINNICISVIPQGAKTSSMLLPVQEESFKSEMKYYPETRGLSLIGKLTEASSSAPVAGKRVNLSVIGEGRDFMAAVTDSSGRFYFALPDYNGSRDLFLCAEKTPATAVKIWVDNDFCTLPVHLPTPEFILSESEKQLVYNLAVNAQVNSQFGSEKQLESQALVRENQAFYGNPSTTLYLDQYVQLPTLEECFNELPSSVKVRRQSGEKYFKVIGSKDLSFYEPLVMVDWVAVDEPAKILAISPQNISRIEIVNQPYVKGAQTYGGIISIVSKKGDFAGIDLPSAGVFINYRFLSENKCADAEVNSIANLPDSRNTLFWKPGILFQRAISESFFTNAPDTPGMYTVVIEYINSKNELVSQKQSFEIRKVY